VVGQRKLDAPLVRQSLGRADEQVSLVEPAFLERRLQRRERVSRPGHDHGSAGLGVESMEDARVARRVADGLPTLRRNELGVVAEEGVHQGARLAWADGRCRLSGGLVDHHHLVRLQHDLEGRSGRRLGRSVGDL
jgi:hypothetical protein